MKETCCDGLRNAFIERAITLHEGKPEITGEGTEETNSHFPLIYCPFCGTSIAAGGGVSLYVDRSVTLRDGDVLLVRGDGFDGDTPTRLRAELGRRGLSRCMVIFQDGELGAVDISRLDSEEMRRLGWVRVEADENTPEARPKWADKNLPIEEIGGVR